MPTFELQTPEGRSFEVDAPDMHTAASSLYQHLGPSQSPINAPLRITVPAATFAGRFEPTEAKQPAASFGSRLLTGFENQGSAASQGTTPDIGAHLPQLVSDQGRENDAGEIVYTDPATGKLVPTNANTQVALRDPVDGSIKIFNRTPETNEGRLSGLGRLVGMGAGTGAPTTRLNLPRVQPQASDIFSTSKPYYRAFKQEAGNIGLPPETATSIADRLRGALAKKDYIPELAPSVYSGISTIERAEPTVDTLQSSKRVIGKSFNSPEKNIRDAAAIASGELGKTISEIAPGAAKNLKTADAIHATALAVQDLQRKREIAGLRTGRAGYGGNAVNAMRQVLSPIVQKAIEGRKTLYTAPEIAAMKEIVNPQESKVINAARLIGQMSPAKGAIQTGLGIATGGITAALGAGANKLATILTGKQIDRLNELVAKRSPAYAQAVNKAIDKYNRAGDRFVDNADTASLAGLIGAARSLSNGLTRDGISVTSGQLLKSITGPVGSRAEDEQSNSPGVLNQ